MKDRIVNIGERFRRDPDSVTTQELRDHAQSIALYDAFADSFDEDDTEGVMPSCPRMAGIVQKYQENPGALTRAELLEYVEYLKMSKGGREDPYFLNDDMRLSAYLHFTSPAEVRRDLRQGFCEYLKDPKHRWNFILLMLAVIITILSVVCF